MSTCLVPYTKVHLNAGSTICCLITIAVLLVRKVSISAYISNPHTEAGSDHKWRVCALWWVINVKFPSKNTVISIWLHVVPELWPLGPDWPLILLFEKRRMFSGESPEVEKVFLFICYQWPIPRVSINKPGAYRGHLGWGWGNRLTPAAA